MIANGINFELLWSTPPDIYLPHMKTFTKHNPGVVQHIAVANHNESKSEGWRNADRNIRNWWKRFGESIKTPNILAFENDVYCNTKINLNFPEKGIGARNTKRPKSSSNWHWFKEISKLPKEIQPYACGMAPLGVSLWPRETLDLICQSKFDDLYNMNIFCELRTASLIRYLGLPVVPITGLERVFYLPTEMNGEPGIHHPVKHKVLD